MDIMTRFQFDDESCIAACVAMLMDEEVENLKGFHECYMAGQVGLKEYIRKRGLLCDEVDFESDLKPGCAYIALAPSLNQFGKLHAVVINVLDTGKVEVHDPWHIAFGVRNRQYVPATRGIMYPHHVRLYSYVPVLVVGI